MVGAGPFQIIFNRFAAKLTRVMAPWIPRDDIQFKQSKNGHYVVQIGLGVVFVIFGLAVAISGLF